MDEERRKQFMELSKEQLVAIIDIKEAHAAAMTMAIDQLFANFGTWPTGFNRLAEVHDAKMAEIVWTTPEKGN
ncbi:MAG: hypothetical protein C3F11_01615 [Methylocystaceae bacterium]|nr:MAG: hypothetical protein C3F11_01615 [Methylocystaceae bacterium]